MKGKRRDLEVNLEDVYKGKMVTFEHPRMRNCTECEGKGGANIKKCSTCKGQGMVTKVVQMGFMIQ